MVNRRIRGRFCASFPLDAPPAVRVTQPAGDFREAAESLARPPFLGARLRSTVPLRQRVQKQLVLARHGV